ncbi:ABC transporter substrate-binding protein [Salipiger sp. P9]|uniref:heme/hemin ABC transporter substrate-binding protein n=1 Tax=Salipiger pentaromativorans TaxID=2943193 RepID=UPI002158046A|nr:ABC transporter substrate-binding protein [Salipiger pentaromativorans]MCR8546715.1 ABC transporter substrate-binding protein [Salipiger pentaromativorans]
MRRRAFHTLALSTAATLVLGGLGAAVLPAEAARGEADTLSIGGSVTEIVYALGQEHRLLARDTTSTYPPEAEALPDVGYMRALSPEGVLSVGPDLILSEEGAGPPETLEVLEEAQIPFITVPGGLDAEGVAAKIRAVGAALGVPEKAEALAAEVTAEIAAASARAQGAAGAPKRVLFVLSAQGGRLMGAGENTGAAAIIALAGGVNALEGVEGYKPLSDEAATAAAPDVILMMDREGDHAASAEELFSLPALAVTPAAETGALIKMDGLKLLGFGPRTGAAVAELSAMLYGD